MALCHKATLSGDKSLVFWRALVGLEQFWASLINEDRLVRIQRRNNLRSRARQTEQWYSLPATLAT